jgi:hypothetical protein
LPPARTCGGSCPRPTCVASALAAVKRAGRFETEWLATDENLVALREPGAWIDRVHERKLPKTIVLDMDSSESPTYGEQEGSA